MNDYNDIVRVLCETDFLSKLSYDIRSIVQMTKQDKHYSNKIDINDVRFVDKIDVPPEFEVYNAGDKIGNSILSPKEADIINELLYQFNNTYITKDVIKNVISYINEKYDTKRRIEIEIDYKSRYIYVKLPDRNSWLRLKYLLGSEM